MKINMNVLIELTETYSIFTLNSLLNELLSEEHKNVKDQVYDKDLQTQLFATEYINFYPICHFVHEQNQKHFITSLDRSVLGS